MTRGYNLQQMRKIAGKVTDIAKKVTKINLRIISKPHAYLKSIVTSSQHL